jgi:hypothetical protein
VWQCLQVFEKQFAVGFERRWPFSRRELMNDRQDVKNNERRNE